MFQSPFSRNVGYVKQLVSFVEIFLHFYWKPSESPLVMLWGVGGQPPVFIILCAGTVIDSGSSMFVIKIGQRAPDDLSVAREAKVNNHRQSTAYVNNGDRSIMSTIQYRNWR